MYLFKFHHRLSKLHREITLPLLSILKMKNLMSTLQMMSRNMPVCPCTRDVIGLWTKNLKMHERSASVERDALRTQSLAIVEREALRTQSLASVEHEALWALSLASTERKALQVRRPLLDALWCNLSLPGTSFEQFLFAICVILLLTQ